MTKPVLHRLDHRNPWVLDTRDLPRGAGQMRELRFTTPAPGGFGTDMIAIPAGGDVDLELRMESVTEGVWVSGRATAVAAGECGRCLEPFERSVSAKFSELYAYDEAALGDPEDLDSQDVSLLVGDLIDLEPAVRDSVMLGFPLNPVCRAECSGLCSICGIKIDDLDDPAGHGHDTIDPRWAALGKLGDLSELQGIDPSADSTPESEES